MAMRYLLRRPCYTTLVITCALTTTSTTTGLLIPMRADSSAPPFRDNVNTPYRPFTNPAASSYHWHSQMFNNVHATSTTTTHTKQQAANQTTMPERRNNNSNDIASMVPITREYLRNFYSNYPNPCIAPQLHHFQRRMTVLRDALHVFDAAELSQILKQIPTRMDHCMYAIRCVCEQTAHILRLQHVVSTQRILEQVCVHFENFQKAQQEHVMSMVTDFLPRDFRTRLFLAARQKSEMKSSAAIQTLMDNGGTIEDKYEQLWQQQWQRRETLSMVANATGIWRFVVRFIAGVPQPLLDFARQINAPNGPTEELRLKFGPALVQLAHFPMHLHALALAIHRTEEHASSEREHALKVLHDAAVLYEREVHAFLNLLTQVVEQSPFFVSPEQISHLREDDALPN